jgi:hypothetical protein
VTERRIIFAAVALVAFLAVVSTVRSWNDWPDEPGRVAVAEFTCDLNCMPTQTSLIDEHCGLPDVTAVRLTVYRSSGERTTREIACLGDGGS